MYRLTEIQEAFQGLIGWRQDYDPAKHIDESLTESSSGLYYQDAHPLVTLDNIRAVMPDTWGLQYPAWSETATYEEGTVVSYTAEEGAKATYWKALQENVGQTPAEGSEYWKQYDIFSDYLQNLTNNGINTTIQTFVQIKQLVNETRNLLERRMFFDGAGRIKATIKNAHKLVGFEITPVRALGVTTKIERIGLQMTGATGIVTMYLFHSSQVDPIKTFELDFTVENGGFQWFKMEDLYLPYLSDGNNAGGSWYLCYDQDALPMGMEAINVSKDWSREPCGTCNIGNVQVWREMTKYLQVMPFTYPAPENFAEYPALWDIAENIYTNTTNYGLNCEVTIGCDLTDFICDQRSLFQTVLQRQVAAIALRQMALNPNVRVNRNQSNVTRMDILYELDGNTSSNRPNGLGYELKKAYEALRIDTQKMSRVCLTCNNHGVKYRTV
jgi:hypothetical protein